ncbi:hypothetical protein BT96DRAFT_829428, partial [Gymnopus androsaceus JB14]
MPFLPHNPAVRPSEKALIDNFRASLDGIKLEDCTTCFEQGFDLGLNGGDECSRCWKDKEGTKKWSAANKVHPAHEIPPCLKGLTEIEEMLIACVKPLMQVRYTKG